MFELLSINSIPVFNPAAQYMFTVFLPGDLDPGGEVSHRVESVSLPGISLSPVRHAVTSNDYYWSYEHLAGEVNFSITFREHEDGKTWKFIQDWFKLIKRSDGQGFYPPAHYYRNIELHCDKKADLLNPLLAETLSEPWLRLVLVDVAPNDHFKLELSYEGSEIIKYDVTFSARKIEQL